MGRVVFRNRFSAFNFDLLPLQHRTLSQQTNGKASLTLGAPNGNQTNDRLSQTELDKRRRIYLLGPGKDGLFVAHALAGIPNPPPITFLMQSYSSNRAWDEHGSAISVTTHGMTETRRLFDVERLLGPGMENNSTDEYGESETEGTAPTDVRSTVAEQPQPGPSQTTIYNLIVSVKATKVADVIAKAADRLTPDSTIYILQNCMGIIDDINQRVFPDSATRPTYIVGVNTHVIHGSSPYSMVHAYEGSMALGILPQERVKNALFPSSARYLLRTITRTAVLAAIGLQPTELLEVQLEKLAVSAVLEPLTVLLDCKNGELVDNSSIKRITRLLLAEISLVIRSLPELRHVTNLGARFAPGRLEHLILLTAERTSRGYSPMYQQTRKGHKQTEIDYINGYFIKRGEELGVQCVLNYMLVQMIKARDTIMRREGDVLPYAGWK